MRAPVRSPIWPFDFDRLLVAVAKNDVEDRDWDALAEHSTDHRRSTVRRSLNSTRTDRVPWAGRPTAPGHTEGQPWTKIAFQGPPETSAAKLKKASVE
jgi:hypothetical protein